MANYLLNYDRPDIPGGPSKLLKKGLEHTARPIGKLRACPEPVEGLWFDKLTVGEFFSRRLEAL